MITNPGKIKYNCYNTEYLFNLYTKYAIKSNTCALITLANVGIYRRFFKSNLSKKYIVFDEGFLAIKNLCKEYKNVEFVEINTKNLIESINNKIMKIDLAIMNPPWDTKTDLHVEVVKTILEKSGATTAISVMPNDFLKTDEYNKKHSRYRNTKIDTMLDCNDEFSIEDTNNLFGLSYSSNCAILCWNNNGSYNYDTVFNDTSKIKEQMKKIEKQIQLLIKNDSVFKSHKKFVKLTEYNGTGYFIPIGTHGANIATEFGLIENNEKAYNYNGKEIIFDKYEKDGLKIDFDYVINGEENEWEINPGKTDISKDSYVSIESNYKPGMYLTIGKKISEGVYDVVLSQDVNGTAQEADSMTFRTILGLTGEDVSFESVLYQGHYLTSHENDLILTSKPNPEEATFKVKSINKNN